MWGSLEYPQQPRHVLQLSVRVPLTIVQELGKIPQISGPVHIPGTAWNPSVKPESVYVEWWQFQMLFHQAHALVVIKHAIRTGFLLAPIVQLGAFTAKEHTPGQV